MKCTHRKEGEEPDKACENCEAKADRRRYFQDRIAKQLIVKTLMEENNLQGREIYESIWQETYGNKKGM